MSSQDAQDPVQDPVIVPDPTPPVAEPEPEFAPVPPAPKRRGFGLVLAALLLGGAATAMAWLDPLGWRGDDALQAEIAALSSRLEASEAAAKTLADRLAALESAPGDAEALAALDAAVKANEAALQALQDAPAIGGDVSAAYVATLAESIDSLKRDMAALGATPASPEAVKAAVDAAIAQLAAEQEAKAQASVEAARQQAARIEAVEQLRAASRSGAPFAEVLPALDGLTVPPVLREAAATGLVTQQALTDAFPEAARNALDAALRAEGSESLGDRLYGFLRIQTGARSLEPREGTDPDAVLSRAEAAVQTGQIQSALDELTGLPPEGQAEMTDWIATAQSWLAAQQALNDLAAAAGLQGG
jgi:hypothetical protein